MIKNKSLLIVAEELNIDVNIICERVRIRRRPTCQFKGCDKKISSYAYKYCRSHAHKLRDFTDKEIINWPSDLDLIKMIIDSNFLQVSKSLNVSDNAVCKRLRNRDYDIKNLQQYIS